MLQPRLVRADAAAICVTGQLRTLLAQAVRTTFAEHLLEPLTNAGFRADVFIYLSADQSADASEVARVTSAVQSAYAPVQLSLRNDTWCDVNCGSRGTLTRNLEHASAVCARCTRPLTQFIGIADCFNAVLHLEANASFKYAWIVRTRSDVVYYSSLRLPLNKTFVYVPAAGMTNKKSIWCHNDHLFVCPRHLCRPYFTLLELWESPFSQSQKRSSLNSLNTSLQLVGATRVGADGWHVAHTTSPPRHYFKMPPIPSSFALRYTSATTAGACSSGILRPLDWAYSLARGNATHGGLVCGSKFNAWFDSRMAGASQARTIMSTCRKLSATWPSEHKFWMLYPNIFCC